VKSLGFIMLGLLAGGLAMAADDLDAKYQSLQEAVAAKNAPEVKKLALELFPMVEAALGEAAPKDDDEKKVWTSHIEHVKSVGVYGEYALFAIAITSPAPTLIEFVTTLESKNLKSQYLDQAYRPYLAALVQTGASAKVPAVAEKALANFPENADLLAVMADTALTRNQTDRALSYSNRLVAAVLKHSKPPEGAPAAEWEKRRSASLGRGYYISGAIYGERGQWVNADKNLRAALPLIQGNQAMTGPAFFYLGMANYNLGKMTNSKAKILEAVQFSEKSAAIPSAVADQARHNALVMKAEADRMR